MALQRGCQANKEKGGFLFLSVALFLMRGEGAAEAGVSEMTEVLCICAFLWRQECCQRLLFCPFYRQANQESGNLRESGRCQGAHQFKPFSDLSALCAILFLSQGRVRSLGKSNFMSFAVSKGNAFPPSSQTSAATAFVMCSWWPQMAKLQTPVFQKRKRLLGVLFMYRDLLSPEY